ncbi:hypothetical protein C8R47DRAFT_1083297 [Mycena vitilis]|nr:hypothetical protein C8R47DRAFT_1083297 [Mycena vitilis]
MATVSSTSWFWFSVVANSARTCAAIEGMQYKGGEAQHKRRLVAERHQDWVNQAIFGSRIVDLELADAWRQEADSLALRHYKADEVVRLRVREKADVVTGFNLIELWIEPKLNMHPSSLLVAGQSPVITRPGAFTGDEERIQTRGDFFVRNLFNFAFKPT